MAFELGKLNKLAPLVGVYAFYNVFATNYPADPVGGMRTALQNFINNPTAIIQKTNNLINLGVVFIGVPILLKSIRLPVAVKMVINLLVYYVIGDQLAALFNGAGRFGAVSYGMRPKSWGGEQSAYHTSQPSAGMIKNTFGGN